MQGAGQGWVEDTRGINDYSGGRVFTIAVIELKEGKTWHDSRYYAEWFEAPDWRTQWLERMEVQASHSPELPGTLLLRLCKNLLGGSEAQMLVVQLVRNGHPLLRFDGPEAFGLRLQRVFSQAL